VRESTNQQTKVAQRDVVEAGPGDATQAPVELGAPPACGGHASATLEGQTAYTSDE
jgi:hypothetical protein